MKKRLVTCFMFGALIGIFTPIGLEAQKASSMLPASVTLVSDSQGPAIVSRTAPGIKQLLLSGDADSGGGIRVYLPIVLR